MTRIEKQGIIDALEHYIPYLKKRVEEAKKTRDYSVLSEYRACLSAAEINLNTFRVALNCPCGEVKI